MLGSPGPDRGVGLQDAAAGRRVRRLSTIGRMPTLERLTADDLRAAIVPVRRRAPAHREPINRLNVYPVPDGDTGTNMTLTMESVVASPRRRLHLADVSQAMAHGSLMGAQGNSGIILSQILRAWAEVFRPPRRSARPS